MKNRHIKTVFAFILLMIAQLAHGQFMYDNKTSSWLFSDASQDKMLAWHVNNHDSIVAPYGMDSYITSSTIVNGKKKKDWVARWNEKCFNKGIFVSFVWSDDKSVTVNLDAFQKAQTNYKCLFRELSSELEPYNDALSYTEFNRRIAAVYNYAKKNPVCKLIVDIYMGWPSTWRVIIANCDNLNLHCYIASDKMLSGASQYGYTRSRLGVISSDADAVFVATPYRKVNTRIIHSNEPSFGGAYFKKHSYDAGFVTYMDGYNSMATASIKRRVNVFDRADFVSGYDSRLYPLSSAAMKMSVPNDEPRLPKLLIAYPDGTISVIDPNNKQEIE